jgi:LicD family
LCRAASTKIFARWFSVPVIYENTLKTFTSQPLQPATANNESLKDFASKVKAQVPSSSTTNFLRWVSVPVNYNKSLNVFAFQPPQPVTNEELLKGFAPRMTPQIQEPFVELIRRVTDALDAVNLTYFMCGGTLLGSYRHHGFIPWDDDADLCILSPDKNQVLAVLNESKPAGDCKAYTNIKGIYTHWKVYSLKNGVAINSTAKLGWKFPFIDIFFIAEQNDSTFVLEWRNIKHLRSDIFPLHRRPFMSLKLWAPHDVRRFLLNEHYAVCALNKTCQTHFRRHDLERAADRVHSAECNRLWSYFPFVFRLNSSITNTSSQLIATTVEQLRIGDKVVQTIEVES